MLHVYKFYICVCNILSLVTCGHSSADQLKVLLAAIIFSSNIFQIVFSKFWPANNSSPLKGSSKCMEILFCPCSLANLESSQLGHSFPSV